MLGNAGLSRRSLLKGGVLAGGLVTAPGLLAGCSALGFGDTLQEIRENGFVRAGIAGERPYAYLEGGRLLGAIAAVHQVIFARLGEIEVQAVQTPFNELIEGLNAGSFDVAAAGMFITAARCERAAFSEPVYCARSALLVPRGNPLGLRDYSSLVGRDALLAVLAGGVEEEYARGAGLADRQLRQVGSPEEGLERLASGEVAAFTLTSISLRALLDRARQQGGPPGPVPDASPAAQAERVELLAPFTPVVGGEEQLGCGGAAFRRTDEALRQAFNTELRALRREGRVLELARPYGFTPAEMPEPGISTEQLCRTGGVTGEELDPLPR